MASSSTKTCTIILFLTLAWISSFQWVHAREIAAVSSSDDHDHDHDDDHVFYDTKKECCRKCKREHCKKSSKFTCFEHDGHFDCECNDDTASVCKRRLPMLIESALIL